MGRNIAHQGRITGNYVAAKAQRKSDHRHSGEHKMTKFSSDMKEQYVRWLSEGKWNPEIISVEVNRNRRCTIISESLCQWIWHGKRLNKASDKP